jgi:hypothetical protein
MVNAYSPEQRALGIEDELVRIFVVRPRDHRSCRKLITAAKIAPIPELASNAASPPSSAATAISTC